MFRPTCLALTIAALAAASCRTGPTEGRFKEWREGALIRRELKDYRVIVSAHKGKVGFLRVEDVREAGGAPYEWKYVQDIHHNEVGFVTQFGSAVKYHVYTPSEQAQQNLSMRGDWLPSDSIENNVMRMLGLDLASDDVTFPVASHEDVAGDWKPHKAGPGITPTPAVEPPAAAK